MTPGTVVGSDQKLEPMGIWCSNWPNWDMMETLHWDSWEFHQLEMIFRFVWACSLGYILTHFRAVSWGWWQQKTNPLECRSYFQTKPKPCVFTVFPRPHFDKCPLSCPGLRAQSWIRRVWKSMLFYLENNLVGGCIATPLKKIRVRQ